MDLEAADVDDAAAPPNEAVAIALALDDIAGVDVALRVEERLRTTEIAERGARRTDEQGVVFHLEAHVGIVRVEECRRKPGAPVRDLEGDASFGRRKRVRNLRSRKRGLQVIDDRLVGDLPG